MEQLPQELILLIVSFLEPRDIVVLKLVSRRLLKISSDNELWRILCVGDSLFWGSIQYRDGKYAGPIPTQEPSKIALKRAVSRFSGNSGEDDKGNALKSSIEATRRSADWALFTPDEGIDWYHEYIARHAPLSMSWLPPAPYSTSQGSGKAEVRGLGLLKENGKNVVVSPMEDASVCLWSITGDDDDPPMSQAGPIIHRSEPGIVQGYTMGYRGPSFIPTDNALDCVSVDQSSGKAYFAAYATLTEVDLTTLQASSQKMFESSICSLSEGGASPFPLTVGTAQFIHIYDPRDSDLRLSPQTHLADGLKLIKPHAKDDTPGFERLLLGDSAPIRGYSLTPRAPTPLSIAHLSHDIHVGGRFPSVLTYDRRFFPHRMTSLWSGARVSALTTISSQHDARQTLVAAGEYNGKGSLELHPLSDSSESQPRQAPPPIKNRVSASRCKLLSVIPHGSRLLFSDGDGQVKWVERDGTTLARRWNINGWSVSSSGVAGEGVLNAGADQGDMARKMLALDHGEKSDVLVWTGLEVGLMGFGTKSRFAHESGESDKGSSGAEGVMEDDETEYGRMMRRALERQANEVRFMRNLGFQD